MSFSISLTSNNKCTAQCDDPLFPLLDMNSNTCRNECNIGIYQYNNECVKQCPDKTIVNNNKCVNDNHLSIINNTHASIDLSLNETIVKVDSNILEYENVHKILYGNGFIFEIYESDSPFDDNSISSIDIGQCETILKAYYHISDDEPLIIVKYDTIISISSINKVEYSVYDHNGNQLKLELCNSVNTDVFYREFIKGRRNERKRCRYIQCGRALL